MPAIYHQTMIQLYIPVFPCSFMFMFANTSLSLTLPEKQELSWTRIVNSISANNPSRLSWQKSHQCYNYMLMDTIIIIVRKSTAMFWSELWIYLYIPIKPISIFSFHIRVHSCINYFYITLLLLLTLHWYFSLVREIRISSRFFQQVSGSNWQFHGTDCWN